MNTSEKIALVAKFVGCTCSGLAIGSALNNVLSRAYDSTNPEDDESDVKYIITKCGIWAASYMAAGTLVTKFFGTCD